MRVAICEDEPLIAEAYRVQLEAAGHAVTAIAARPHDCLAACAEDRPDIVLVDLQLADGLRGEPLVDALAGMGIPSIIVSGLPKVSRVDTRARGILRKSPRFREVLQALRLVEWTLGMDALRQGRREAGAEGPPPA